ncbi:hypothetical protein SASC598P14_009320 [Snodgrassella alvi SCGC AB-598-P14]|nr:hypothetical protein SASC598P14_009320 [Snodgrassella alvi SCGC AB-598-P14]
MKNHLAESINVSIENINIFTDLYYCFYLYLLNITLKEYFFIIINDGVLINTPS